MAVLLNVCHCAGPGPAWTLFFVDLGSFLVLCSVVFWCALRCTPRARRGSSRAKSTSLKSKVVAAVGNKLSGITRTTGKGSTAGGADVVQPKAAETDSKSEPEALGNDSKAEPEAAKSESKSQSHSEDASASSSQPPDDDDTEEDELLKQRKDMLQKIRKLQFAKTAAAKMAKEEAEYMAQTARVIVQREQQYRWDETVGCVNILITHLQCLNALTWTFSAVPWYCPLPSSETLVSPHLLPQ